MKIVQFINNLAQGGAEAVVKEYSLELKRRGHNIQVITLFPFVHTQNEEILKENGIVIRSIFEEIYKIKSYCFILRVIRKPFKKVLVSKWLKKYINDFSPDVIHIHLSLLTYFTPLKDVISENKTKLFFTCHSEAKYYFGETQQKDIAIAKQLIKDDNLQIIALHNEMQSELKNIFATKNVYCLPNPVNITDIENPKKDKYTMKELLGIPQNTFVIGSNGRFIDIKNHNFLIKVFSKVKKVNPNAFLLLIGTGELKEDIIKQLNNLGLQNDYLILSDRRDIPELLNVMDIFAFPSKFEGLGIALIEAEAAKLPCVVSDKVPALALAGEKTIQLGIKDEDVDIWADNIINYYKIKSDFGDVHHFDLSNIINQLEELYNN